MINSHRRMLLKEEVISETENRLLHGTDNYFLYRQIYNKFNKYCKNDEYLSDYFIFFNSYSLDLVKIGAPLKLYKGYKLYHFSNINGLTKLRSCFKSHDGTALYSENRIYFSLTCSKPYDIEGQYMYEYTCTGNENIRIDTEYGLDLKCFVYVYDLDYFSLPVRQIDSDMVNVKIIN